MIAKLFNGLKSLIVHGAPRYITGPMTFDQATVSRWRHNIQHYDKQHNEIQRNETQQCIVYAECRK